MTNQLKLNQTLNATIKSVYSLFIYVSYLSTQSIQFYKPTSSNIALFFIDIYVSNVNGSNNMPFFTEYTQYMSKYFLNLNL